MTAQTLHLDSPDLTWGTHQIAGAELPADMTMLRADAERGTRVVVVRFPDGWRRDVTGNQPAGEEMVVLSGALTISGQTCAAGQMMVIEPRATRAATSVLDGTSALVWFSGAGGGWADGEADAPGAATLLTVDAELERAERDGLVGAISTLPDASGAVFDVDVDLYWPQARTWAFVPAGSEAPEISGFAIVHSWG